MRRPALLAAAMVALAVPVHAQQTERVGRIELSNGYLSVDARSDGLVLLSAIGTLKFGVGSAAFSPRTLTAWLAEVDRSTDSIHRADVPRAGRAPLLFAVDAATYLTLTFQLTPAPSLTAAVFARADGAEIALAGTADDSSFARLVDAVRRGIRRTTELTLFSRDSARMYLSDAELSGRTTARDSIAAHPPTTWRTADRVFVTVSTSALAGLGLSYARHAAAHCVSAPGYCRWRLANPGFAVGASIGAAGAAIAFTQNGSCTQTRRVATSLATSVVAAIPGSLIARSGRQVAIAVTPSLQAAALEIALRDCRGHR